MKKHTLLFLALMLALATTATAQLPSSLRFGRISVEKGLSQATVYYSYQDSKGFLWFGTEDGLNKYDGYSFDIYKYDPSDHRTISNNIIRYIFEDSKQTLWVGTDNGLNVYNNQNGSFKRYLNSQEAGSISNNLISSIAEDKKGIVWIGTSNGLNSFDRNTGKFTVYKSNPAAPNSLSSNVISAVISDRNGNLWIGTASDGLNFYDAATGTFSRIQHNPSDPGSLSENEITTLYCDESNTIYVGTANGGLNILRNGSGKFTHLSSDNGLSSNSIFGVNKDKQGNVWIGTLGGGLNVVDRSGNIKVYRRDPINIESLSSNKIWSIFVDRAQTIWVSTSNGISFYNRTIAKFVTHRIAESTDGSSNNSVFAICEDRQGYAWVGVLGGGLNVFSRSEGRFVNERFPSLNNPQVRFSNIFSIIEDNDGTLWLGTMEGLLNFNKSNGQVREFKTGSGLSNNYVRCLYLDRNNILWIGTNGGGLNAYNKTTGKFMVYRSGSDANSLSSDVIMDITEDSEGTLWIATYGGGICSYNKGTGKFTSYKNDGSNANTISTNFIHNLFIDKDKKIWIGTYGGGLNVFDRSKNTFTHYTEREGLPNNIINGILADNSNNIWASTNNGVCKLNISNGQSSITSNTRSYNVQDGLQNKFNENSLYKGSGGWLYFGGSNGLNAFHPDSIKDNLVIPPIVITRFYLFEKPTRMDTLITSNRTLDLNYRQNTFSFDFAALNYLFPEKNRYAYKMEGLNDEWIYSGSRRYAAYTNLDPGKYVFRVKACNNDGVWNEEGFSVAITITPPIWKTWWFIGLSALFITALVFVYIRIRTISLVRQNIVLEEKVNTRTHQLQEKNVELTKTMENLRSTQNQLIQSEKMASLGQLTAGIAHEIQNPLNFVNNFSELSVELVDELDMVPPLPDDEKKMIVGDLKQNLEKIVFHGKRADSIVKGMLQHSRTSSAEKQPTDINKLVDEFLNLAYHGMRAKDPAFNCAMEKNLATDIPMISIIPQDVSRVILNIFNNSFYAIDEKAKSAGKGYQPTVSIETKRLNDKILIKIRDNGKGIPDDIRDKIFNPFFTTKPTGQGTGLGLSISYDIIVKGHNGDIAVDSKAGEYTEFTITLPIS